MTEWLLIDDNHEEAAAFADRISCERLRVTPMSAKQAKVLLADPAKAPDGILMDVDLSNETAANTTGPGLAQDFRVAMQKGMRSFPIVRFSWREKVASLIGHDPSSDDLFDMKIEKDGIQDTGVDQLRGKLTAITEVYEAAELTQPATELLKITEELWAVWGHSEFQSRLERDDRAYLKAGDVIRLLLHAGLLVNEDLLAFRLGVDRSRSSDWSTITKELQQIKYIGPGSEGLPRWWARGLGAWWSNLAPQALPLAACTISERVEVLSSKFSNLSPLQMPKGSLGDRPWRFCSLTFEQEGRFIPVDPDEAVRIHPRSPMPAWLDPLYAAAGPALRASKTDRRLDQADLRRMSMRARQMTQ